MGIGDRRWASYAHDADSSPSDESGPSDESAEPAVADEDWRRAG